MQRWLSILLSVVVLSCFSSFAQQEQKLRQKAAKAKVYCASNTMNADICFLIDMSIHSGKYRLFIWDFTGDSILYKAKCSHGCCNSNWSSDDSSTNPTFSNVPDSHCSSLGKYRIGSRGWSNLGIHVNYKLHGLEEQNSNAYRRYIVFHSWDIMPDEETYPDGAPESWGCPAVSNSFMQLADQQLKAQENKNVLLWIYQ